MKYNENEYPAPGFNLVLIWFFLTQFQENSTHKQLWTISQHTIDYLEREISVYLKQSNNPNLLAQLKIECESSLRRLQCENEQLKSSKMSLQQSKQMCEQQLSILDKKHNGECLSA